MATISKRTKESQPASVQDEANGFAQSTPVEGETAGSGVVQDETPLEQPEVDLPLAEVGDMAKWWEVRDNVLTGLPAVLVGKQLTNPEWILTIFLPLGGAISSRRGKQSPEPKAGYWTKK